LEPYNAPGAVIMRANTITRQEVLTSRPPESAMTVY